MSQTISSELFRRKNSTYNLQSKSDFAIPPVRIVFKESSSISYYTPIIWSLVPEDIRYADSLEIFKSKIRTWKHEDSLCCICKIYIPNAGCLEIFEQYF